MSLVYAEQGQMNQNDERNQRGPGEQRPPQGMGSMINIGPNGMTQLRGKLLSVASTTLTVGSWGITFVVDISNANITGPADVPTAFVVGDFVGVIGKASADNALNITAKIARDWNGKPAPKKTRLQLEHGEGHDQGQKGQGSASTTER